MSQQYETHRTSTAPDFSSRALNAIPFESQEWSSVSRTIENWLFNVSVKWIALESDVRSGGPKLNNAQLDPLEWSLGFS